MLALSECRVQNTSLPDLATLGKAKQVDPTYKRTILVRNKLDKCPMSVGVGSVAHQLIRKLLKTIHCFTVVDLAIQFLTHPILFRSFLFAGTTMI